MKRFDFILSEELEFNGFQQKAWLEAPKTNGQAKFAI